MYPTPTCEECGDCDAAEGYRYCVDCLELLTALGDDPS